MPLVLSPSPSKSHTPDNRARYSPFRGTDVDRFKTWFSDETPERQTPNDATPTVTPYEQNTPGKNSPYVDEAFSHLPDSDSDAYRDVPTGDVSGEPLSAGGDEVAVARLPQALAGREETPTLTPRFNRHREFNDQVRTDWMRIIEDSPDAFQALLYRPKENTYTIETDEDGNETFTELDRNQQVLSYQEPVIVSVLDNPDGRESFQAIDADGEQDGLTDDVLVLRVAASDVSVGSILEWNEEMAHGTARRWWYVHRIYSYGTQHVGSLYYCIPARNFDTLADGADV